VASSLESRKAAPGTAALRAELSAGRLPPGFVGAAPGIRDVFRVVGKAAPTNATVLILGESGTGKELVAEAIHRASPREGRPFVKVNCAALPEGLLESELFGHVKGAFTGAVSERAGRFEAANGGTLFLDEVGEVPAHTQVKLLRVLQNREIERLGESKPVDVRLIAATNADLDARVRSGAFREDFYFRLKVVTIRMPPLRERRGDVPLLARHFQRTYAARHGRPAGGITPEALVLLETHGWPGNVRELENVIEAAVVLSDDGTITPDVLPVEVGGRQRVEDLPEAEGLRLAPGTSLPEAERRLILDTLRRTDGNKTAAARILGIGLRTLYRKLEHYEAEDAGRADASGS
jgi:DNA-binding NtrC family response regulator